MFPSYLQHDAVVQACLLARAPAAATGQVGLHDVASPDPRHGGEAALPGHGPGLHHHQLHWVGQAVRALKSTRNDQSLDIEDNYRS